MTNSLPRRLLAASLVAAALVVAGGCDGDEDDCVTCCECAVETSGPELVYTLGSGACTSCVEQCADFAKTEFSAEPNYFERVTEIECED